MKNIFKVWMFLAMTIVFTLTLPIIIVLSPAIAAYEFTNNFFSKKDKINRNVEALFDNKWNIYKKNNYTKVDSKLDWLSWFDEYNDEGK